MQGSLQRTVLLMVLLNAFATPLMLSASNVALPHIAKDLQLDAVLIAWVPMVYLMASAMFVLVFGRLADMLGRKRIFLLGTIGLILTSVFVAMAQSAAFLIAARFLQGISAAMLYATQVAIVSSVFAPQQRGRAIGLTVSVIYLGLTCGPLLGGIMVDLYGWRASFLLHIPLAIVVLLIGFCRVDEEWSATDPGGFDFKGAVLYGISVASLCLAVTDLNSLHGLLFLLLGCFALWGFVKLEQGLSHPLFDVTLFFSNRVFAFSCCASLIIYAAVFANIFLLSFYLQCFKDFSVTITGMIIMVQPLTMAIFSPWIGRLSDRIEPGILASVGMLVTALGLLLLGLLDMHSDIYELVFALILTGMGFSLFSSPNANAIMSTVEKRYYGAAAGSLATMRIIGQMMSMVLVVLVFAMFVGSVEIEPSMYHSLEQAIRMCFFIAAGLCVPGAMFSLVRGRIHH